MKREAICNVTSEGLSLSLLSEACSSLSLMTASPLSACLYEMASSPEILLIWSSEKISEGVGVIEKLSLLRQAMVVKEKLISSHACSFVCITCNGSVLPVLSR